MDRCLGLRPRLLFGAPLALFLWVAVCEWSEREADGLTVARQRRAERYILVMKEMPEQILNTGPRADSGRVQGEAGCLKKRGDGCCD